MKQDLGASVGPGSRASTEPQSTQGLGPAGFDPSRDDLLVQKVIIAILSASVPHRSPVPGAIESRSLGYYLSAGIDHFGHDHARYDTLLERAAEQAIAMAREGDPGRLGALEDLPSGDYDDTDHSRAPWDIRPRPGHSDEDPMCINLYCPSAFSCRRFSQVPHQGENGTICIDPEPTLLNGILCEDFDPDCPRPPSDSDGSGEAGETGTGSTVGDSAGPKDIAQPQSPNPKQEGE